MAERKLEPREAYEGAMLQVQTRLRERPVTDGELLSLQLVISRFSRVMFDDKSGRLSAVFPAADPATAIQHFTNALHVVLLVAPPGDMTPPQATPA